MKDAYYFSHDSNARNDLKMIKIRRLHGLEGYGLFFCVIEMLRETNGYKLNLSAIPEICFDLRVKENVFEGLFESGLLQKNGEYFYSESLLKRMEILEGIREKRSISGKKGAMAKHDNSKYKASDEQLPDTCQANDKQVKESKEKEIKVDEKKESKVDSEFEIFWNLYDKKVGDKEKIKNKFFKLKDEERKKIFETLPKYVQSTLDKQYRKNPETYLNNKSWNDEIVTRPDPFINSNPGIERPSDFN